MTSRSTDGEAPAGGSAEGHRQGESRVIWEPGRATPVVATCDVLVAGGGPAGCAAAAAAAAAGAQVVLVERYGYLGGMSTGGFVLWIDRMSDWQGRPVVGGVGEELLSRLPEEALLGPPRSLWGSQETEAVAYWGVRHAAMHGVVTWSPTIDPEWLKLVNFDLLRERGVRLRLHSWVVAALMENGAVAGALLESKAGRAAVRARVVVDATGDGDVFTSGGAAYDTDVAEGTWHHTMNLGFRWAGVDTERFSELLAAGAVRALLADAEGFGAADLPYLSPHPGVVFFMAPKLSGYDCLSVEDLTAVELESRRLMRAMLLYYRDHVPGFERAWILDTAPQLGVRHSRRLRGTHKVTRAQWLAGLRHEDEVGLCPSPSPEIPSISIPLGCLVPGEVDGVLAAGRSLSCDALSHLYLREIPICWVTGQAAGVVAALAAAAGCAPREVPAAAVQQELVRQGAVLRMG